MAPEADYSSSSPDSSLDTLQSPSPKPAHHSMIPSWDRNSSSRRGTAGFPSNIEYDAVRTSNRRYAAPRYRSSSRSNQNGNHRRSNGDMSSQRWSLTTSLRLSSIFLSPQSLPWHLSRGDLKHLDVNCCPKCGQSSPRRASPGKGLWIVLLYVLRCLFSCIPRSYMPSDNHI